MTTYDLFPDGKSVLVTATNANGRGMDRFIGVLTNWSARLPTAGAGR